MIWRVYFNKIFIILGLYIVDNYPVLPITTTAQVEKYSKKTSDPVAPEKQYSYYSPDKYLSFFSTEHNKPSILQS